MKEIDHLTEKTGSPTQETLKKLLEKVFDEQFEMLTSLENFKDLEFWDSLMYVNLVVAIQAEFKVALTKDEIQKILSVNGIETILLNHGIEL